MPQNFDDYGHMSIEEQVSRFKMLKHPKILFSNDRIEIRDRPFGWNIFLVAFMVCCCAFAINLPSTFDKPIALVITFAFLFIFCYDALSLTRTTIDFGKKTIYRRSINPLENLLSFVLKHPSIISFNDAKNISIRYTETYGPVRTKYYLCILTEDPYKLRIATFKRRIDGENFATFLKKRF
jgi:hypothetical protein